MQHLVLYASHDGQTERMATCISEEMKTAGLTVERLNIERLSSGFSLDQYQSVLIGAPIRYGHHLPAARDFIQKHAQQLQRKAGGFFSVNLTARKPEKQDPATNRYMVKFLKSSPWQPPYQGVLAGSLMYSRYGFFDRVMIQLIMKITKGSTDASKDVEYTDWGKVSEFAAGYVAYLKSAGNEVKQP